MNIIVNISQNYHFNMKRIKKLLLAILLTFIMPIIVLFWHYEYYDDLPKWLRRWIEYIDY